MEMSKCVDDKKKYYRNIAYAIVIYDILMLLFICLKNGIVVSCMSIAFSVFIVHTWNKIQSFLKIK